MFAHQKFSFQEENKSFWPMTGNWIRNNFILLEKEYFIDERTFVTGWNKFLPYEGLNIKILNKFQM